MSAEGRRGFFRALLGEAARVASDQLPAAEAGPVAVTVPHDQLDIASALLSLGVLQAGEQGDAFVLRPAHGLPASSAALAWVTRCAAGTPPMAQVPRDALLLETVRAEVRR